MPVIEAQMEHYAERLVSEGDMSRKAQEQDVEIYITARERDSAELQLDAFEQQAKTWRRKAIVNEHCELEADARARRAEKLLEYQSGAHKEHEAKLEHTSF